MNDVVSVRQDAIDVKHARMVGECLSECVTGTRRGECFKAKALQIPRASRVPRIGNHEATLLMKPTKLGSSSCELIYTFILIWRPESRIGHWEAHVVYTTNGQPNS